MDLTAFRLAFSGGLIGLVQLLPQGSLHPITMRIAQYSFILSGFLELIKLTFPNFYKPLVKLVSEVYSWISLASITSLLLPAKIMCPIFLSMPAWKILCWIFLKMEQHFGDTEFWRFLLNLMFDLRRMMNRVFHMREVWPILPL
ncbi:uncharacterized protein LOC132031147 [Lycium ferocissimum]|uniref:uncharacterized protein LOC132031147 n=1 Tax=Lycium ferocissimum TaxID=112874 RepID=UPI002815685B|nr:uncharacterized protein LOC132031147 [Lycium ferocissimum]